MHTYTAETINYIHTYMCTCYYTKPCFCIQNVGRWCVACTWSTRFYTHHSQHDLLFEFSEWYFLPRTSRSSPTCGMSSVWATYLSLPLSLSLSVLPSLSPSLSLPHSLSVPPLSLPLWPSFSDPSTLSFSLCKVWHFPVQQ